MPIVEERTVQKPHAEYAKIISSGRYCSQVKQDITYPQGIYYCLILDYDVEFSRFLIVKKER